MLIRSARIRNYRCIQNLDVEFSSLTAFVGRNGGGKSSILHALDAFFTIKAPLTEADFFNSDTSTPIEIMVEFYDLKPEEEAEFAAYVNGDSLAVTKKVEYGVGKLIQRYFAARRQIPALALVRAESTITQRRQGWNKLVSESALPDIGPTSRQGDDLDVLMQAYEEKHPELLEWVQQEMQFLGATNVGAGKLDNFTKFVYIPAVRDASEDSTDKKGSPLFQLLDYLVMRRFHARQDVIDLKAEFSNRVKDLYKPESLTEFASLSTEISKTLSLYVPNAQLELRVSEPTLPEIPNPATVAHLIEDEYTGSIDRKGHGLQRALILTLLQLFAVSQPVEPDGTTVVSEGSTGNSGGDVTENSEGQNTGAFSPDLIIAIEEPELYQHPLRARHLSKILRTMADGTSLGVGARNQVFYTTHSPYFVDLERFDQIRVVRKGKRTLSDPPSTVVTGYTLQDAADKMAAITGLPATQFTADTFRTRAHPVMTQIVNEGFFAEVVVLVEGDTEAGALWSLSRILDFDWLSMGIAVVAVGGKTKIDRAAVIFRGLCIPVYVVFDADGRHKTDNDMRAKTATANRTLLALCNTTVEDYPSSAAELTHACFEDDFEEYCRSAIGKDVYNELRQAVADSHGYESAKNSVKNFEVISDLVVAIYNSGKRLELLETVVQHVSVLVTTFRVGEKDETTLNTPSSAEAAH